MKETVEKHVLSPYSNYWNDDATSKWKTDAEETLRQRCADARFDYQTYIKDGQFSKLEEAIAQNLYGITESLAIRALRSNNVLSAFNHQQRENARNIRKKMEKIGGKEKIDMQVVPLLLRTDEDIVAKKSHSRAVSVFRVKCKESDKRTQKYVDANARIYDTWKDFLENNQLPKGMLCYPADGFLRNVGSALKKKVSIKFGETPACSLKSRAWSCASTAAAWLSPIATVGLFWCPAGWIGMGMSIATKFVLGFTLFQQSCTIYDKAAHDERYGMDIFHLVTTLGTLVVQKALPQYMKSVAKSHRQLTRLEYWMITAFLCGMSASQVLSFVGMMYTICSKKEITSLDIVNFAVACQNMYSCIISPKTAQQMLNQVKGELANQEYEKMCREEAKEQKLKGEIAELRRKEQIALEKGENVDKIRREIAQKHEEVKTAIANQKLYQEEFQSYKSDDLEQAYLKKVKLNDLKKELDDLESQLQALNGNGEESEQIRRQIRQKNEEFENCEREIIRYQEQHQKAVKDKMKNDGAKEKYQEFIDNETNRQSSKMHIDSNGRIIQAMFEMDAEVVFTYAFEENTTIRFTNGEKLDLAINNRIDIHPRALSQLCKNTNPGTQDKEDLKKVMELTKKLEDGNLTRDKYLTDIKKVLKTHRMMARDEIAELSSQVKRFMEIPNETNSRFDNLTPAEAYRLRTVMDEVGAGEKKLVMDAAILLAEDLHYADNIFRLAECIEVIKVTAADKSKRFERARNEIPANVADRNAALAELCGNILGASEDEIARLQERDFGKKAVKRMVYEQLSSAGDKARGLAQHVNQRMEEVEALYFGENAPTLPFSHPLAAVYHEMKHGHDAARDYASLTQAERDRAYFHTLPKEFFDEGFQANWKETSVSQNGMSISRTWRTSNGYLGVTKTPYTPSGDLNAIDHSSDPLLLGYMRKLAPSRHLLYTSRLEGEQIATHFRP